MKEEMRTIRLLVGAADCARSQIPVAEEFAPQIIEARTRLASMRASDILDAVIAVNRSGLDLALDVRDRSPRSLNTEQSRPPDTRRR